MNQTKSLKLYIIKIQQDTVLTSSTKWPANIQPKLDHIDGLSTFSYNTLDLAAINASIQYKEITAKHIIRGDFILQIAVELQKHYKQRGNNHPSREDDESDDEFEAATISKKRRQYQVMKCKCNKTSEQCHKCKMFVGNAQTGHIKNWFAVIVRKSIQNQNHEKDTVIESIFL